MNHKFLHLADIHFDAPFLCRAESLRAKLRKEQQAAFKRSIDFAINEKMMAVVVAGDMLQGNRVSLATESFILDQFRRLDQAQIPAIYVAGHSDPVDPMARAAGMPWPASFVHVRERMPKVIELQDVDGSAIVRLVGVGHDPAKKEGAAVVRLPQVDNDIPYIGIMHTDLAARSETALRDAFDAEMLQAAGYAYWALGGSHAHRRAEGMDSAWYAGGLIGTGPSETGAKGGIAVTVKRDGSIETEFKSFSAVRWYDIVLDDLEGVQNVDDLARLVELAFAVESEGNESVAVRLVRITLTGMCALADELRAEARRTTIEENIAQRLQVDDVEIRTQYLTLPVDIEPYRDQPHLLSEVLRVIETVSTDAELLDELTPDPLASQFATPEDRQAYVSRLLQAMDREAIIRLTHEDSHAH